MCNIKLMCLQVTLENVNGLDTIDSYYDVRGGVCKATLFVSRDDMFALRGLLCL